VHSCGELVTSRRCPGCLIRDVRLLVGDWLDNEVNEMGIEIHLLGSVEAVRGAVPIDLRGPRQRRLLAVLALRAGRLVGVDEIIDAVWPESEHPPDARETLRTYISRLRGSLGGADFVQGRDGGYVLAVAPGCVDALRFAALVNEPVVLEQRIEMLTIGLDLWHGPALAGFAHEEWARSDAVRLAEMRSFAADELGAALIGDSRPQEALAGLEAAVTAEPLRERTRCLLMQALHATGRTAEALRTFQEYRRYLAAELGVEPGEEIRDRDRHIASGAAPERPPAKAPIASGSDGRRVDKRPSIPIPTPTSQRRSATAMSRSVVVPRPLRVHRLAGGIEREVTAGKHTAETEPASMSLDPRPQTQPILSVEAASMDLERFGTEMARREQRLRRQAAMTLLLSVLALMVGGVALGFR
jgi:DNA-binding SARP family transcriptional activator